MKIYIIRMKSTGEIVGNPYYTYLGALKELEDFEKDDKNMGYYEPDSYIIEAHTIVYRDTDSIFYE